MISTRDLSGLPDPARLRRVMQSMAVLDAIICPDWQFRYYSFNARWADGEQCGSMRNGSGDDLYALFNASGCFLRGFAHEYEMSAYREDPPRLWPGMLDDVPGEFAAGLAEPAFGVATQTTFCIWRRYTDPAWLHGPIEFPPDDDPDGSAFLLSVYDGRPETYHTWAEDDYYQRPVSLDVVRAVYAHIPITAEMVSDLNPSLSLEALAADLDEMGYPSPAHP